LLQDRIHCSLFCFNLVKKKFIHFRVLIMLAFMGRKINFKVS